MKVSLVIPAHNEEKYIKACLESVTRFASEHPVLAEIIVVDNASTDTTAEIAKKFPKVRVIAEKKKGLTKARERGFKEATGDIIAYIDADTRMPPGWVQKLVDEFSSNEKLVCLSGPYRYYDLKPLSNFTVAMYWGLFALPTYLVLGYMAIGGNFAAKKSALTEIGGFDTNIEFYGEDTNIARRLHKVGKVKFTMSFFMPTSARRFKGEGFWKIGLTYALNYFSEAIFHKPITKSYKDIR